MFEKFFYHKIISKINLDIKYWYLFSFWVSLFNNDGIVKKLSNSIELNISSIRSWLYLFIKVEKKDKIFWVWYGLSTDSLSTPSLSTDRFIDTQFIDRPFYRQPVYRHDVWSTSPFYWHDRFIKTTVSFTVHLSK